MNTSYFFSNKLNKEQRLISISTSIPKNIKNILPSIITYKPLCPTWKWYKIIKGRLFQKKNIQKFILVIFR